MCHPVVFLFLVAGVPFIFKLLISETGSTNIFQINLIPYAFVTSVFYLVAVHIQYSILKLLRAKLSIAKFFQAKLTLGPIVIAVFGSFHIANWISGMEGNIMGFIFFPYVILLSLASLSLFIKHIVCALEGGFDV